MIDFNDTKPLGLERHRYDLDEIVRRLRETAEQWVPSHFPNGRRVGDEWRLANIRGDAPRKQGSCVISLKGEHAGDWIDFDGTAGGGPLSTLEEATGLSRRDLFAHAAETVGWSPGAPSRQEPTRAPKAERDPTREIAFILSHTHPIKDSPAAAFLRGRGLDIPAAAEVVVEGLLHPAIRESEGPLAEFHGYHGEPWNSPTLEVTCISWRNDPIYQTIIPGWYEHIYIGNVLPREPLLRRFVRHLDPHADVHIPPYGNGFLALVQIDRDNPGTPKNLAMAAMAAHINIRNVIVVDRDVDMFEPAEVQWALTNRVHWGDDVFAVPFAQGHEMDPTADQRGISTKVGIDATYKRERREYGERVSYPAVDLGDYLP